MQRVKIERSIANRFPFFIVEYIGALERLRCSKRREADYDITADACAAIEAVQEIAVVHKVQPDRLANRRFKLQATGKRLQPLITDTGARLPSSLHHVRDERGHLPR